MLAQISTNISVDLPPVLVNTVNAFLTKHAMEVGIAVWFFNLYGLKMIDGLKGKYKILDWVIWAMEHFHGGSLTPPIQPQPPTPNGTDQTDLPAKTNVANQQTAAAQPTAATK